MKGTFVSKKDIETVKWKKLNIMALHNIQSHLEVIKLGMMLWNSTKRVAEGTIF
jgi:hypothetical protein